MRRTIGNGFWLRVSDRLERAGVPPNAGSDRAAARPRARRRGHRPSDADVCAFPLGAYGRPGSPALAHRGGEAQERGPTPPRTRESFDLPELAVDAPPHAENDLVRWAERVLPADAEEPRRTLEWMIREGDGEKLESIAESEQIPGPRLRKRVSRLRRHLRAEWKKEIALLAALGIVAVLIWLARRGHEPVAHEPIRPLPMEMIPPRALRRSVPPRLPFPPCPGARSHRLAVPVVSADVVVAFPARGRSHQEDRTRSHRHFVVIGLTSLSSWFPACGTTEFASPPRRRCSRSPCSAASPRGTKRASTRRGVRARRCCAR